MGQNIVNCVTWLWGGRLSALPLLFYLLSSHLLPLSFPYFCQLLFLSSALTSSLLSLLFAHPLNLPLAPFLALTALILYSTPFGLSSYLPTSLFYTSPLRLSSPALWLSAETDRTWAKPLASSPSPSIPLMVDWHILENPWCPNQ